VSDRVFVTGIGVISALGFDIDENRFRIAEIKKRHWPQFRFFDTVYKEEIPVAEVKASNIELAERQQVKTGWIVFPDFPAGAYRCTAGICHRLRSGILPEPGPV